MGRDRLDTSIPRTSGTRPTGGRVKVEPEDFVVEEVPAYGPSGSGEHLMLWVEKRDLTTDQVARRLAAHYGVGPGGVGTAGLKDRRAVTRQSFTVHAPAASTGAPDLGDEARVLRVERHDRKMRTGHLRANRFRVRIRETALPPARAAAEARAMLEGAASHGMVNFYGPQRFGRQGETLAWGFALIAGDGAAVPSRIRRSRMLRRLALSAVQSRVYNAYLARRWHDGLVGRVLAGDVMRKVDGGGTFNVEPGRLEREQARLDAREIVHAGPIPGRKTFPARAEALARERVVFEELCLDPQDFTRHGRLLSGARRPDLVLVREAEVSATDDGMELSFTLPPGCYATVLLGEIAGDVVDRPAQPPSR
jgi:tRNA pseudouridine13 synthase